MVGRKGNVVFSAPCGGGSVANREVAAIRSLFLRVLIRCRSVANREVAAIRSHYSQRPLERCSVANREVAAIRSRKHTTAC